MRTESFDFTGADGQSLSGRLDLPDGPVRAHALFAHCFTCTRNSLAAVHVARALAARGIAVLRFDFTGLGESEGEFAGSTFSGNVQDLEAAARAMQERGMAPALLVGHSFGGAAVLAAAGALDSVTAVATIAAPFDVAHITGLLGDQVRQIRDAGEASVDLGGRPFPIRRGFLEDLDRHDQGERIRALRKPLLVLHAPQDAVVDIDNAGRIFEAAMHPKSFVSLDGADHLLTRRADADYVAGVIAAWSRRYVAGDDAVRAHEDGLVHVAETGVGGYQVEVGIGAARLLADEPTGVGGLGSGPTPYELLSAALGACTVMTLRMYANHKKLPVRRIGARIGHRKEKGVPVPDLFTRSVSIDGDIDDAQRQRLVEIAERCPVHRTLQGGARVETVQAGGAGSLPAPEPVEQHAAEMHDAGDAGA